MSVLLVITWHPSLLNKTYLGSGSTAGIPVLIEARSRLVKTISVSDSSVMLATSGEVSPDDWEVVGDTRVVYGVPRSPLITPVDRSGVLGGGGLCRGGLWLWPRGLEAGVLARGDGRVFSSSSSELLELELGLLRLSRPLASELLLLVS